MFYLNGKKIHEDDGEPYTWCFNERATGFYKIRVEIYSKGKMIGREKGVLMFNI